MLPKGVYFTVQYPGYVENHEKALDSLGGEEVIGKALQKDGKFLALRHRPEDDFEHPLYGDIVPLSNTFLAKIHHEPSNDNEKVNHNAELIGRITKQTTFLGLSDFQVSSIRTPSDKDAKVGGEDDDIPVFAPMVFSRYDYVRDYRFQTVVQKDFPKNTRTARMTKDRELPELLKEGSVKRQSRSGPVTPFSTPTIPEALPDLDQQIAKDPLLGTMQSLFIQRPIWSRAAIIKHLPPPPADENDPRGISRRLYVVAYLFTGGPWNKIYVRRGCDPRQDPEMRIYQTISYLLPPNIRETLGLIKAQGPSRAAPVRSSNRGNQSKQAGDGDDDNDDENEDDDANDDRDEDIHFNRLSSGPSPLLQLCDIEDEEIQKIVRSAKPIAKCHPRHGWYSAANWSKIKKLFDERKNRLITAALEQKKQESLPGESPVKAILDAVVRKRHGEKKIEKKKRSRRSKEEKSEGKSGGRRSSGGKRSSKRRKKKEGSEEELDLPLQTVLDNAEAKLPAAELQDVKDALSSLAKQEQNKNQNQEKNGDKEIPDSEEEEEEDAVEAFSILGE